MNILLSETQIATIVQKLSDDMLNKYPNLSNVILLGVQPRGVYLSNKIVAYLKNKTGAILYGKLDITFYRDDVRKTLHHANETDIPFNLEDKIVILIDDVLYTGRTTRAALDAISDFGRPERVELCVLIDRRTSREYPIQANYVGYGIDSTASQKVKVFWKNKDGKEQVEIIDN